MDNFIFHNPTRLIFGKGMIAQLSQQIPADKRIMITFGGGSVKTNGVYEQVIQALEGRDYTEFWAHFCGILGQSLSSRAQGLLQALVSCQYHVVNTRGQPVPSGSALAWPAASHRRQEQRAESAPQGGST